MHINCSKNIFPNKEIKKMFLKNKLFFRKELNDFVSMYFSSTFRRFLEMDYHLVEKQNLYLFPSMFGYFHIFLQISCSKWRSE